MNDISVLLGGKAGDGIREAGSVVANLLSGLGYRVYFYYDYPSLIRGGHNFSIVRASQKKMGTLLSTVDFVLALNQDTVILHKERIKRDTVLIYDADAVKAEGLAVPAGAMVREEKAPTMMRSSSLIGAFCAAAGIGWKTSEKLLKKSFPKQTELNMKLASRGYKQARKIKKVEAVPQSRLPVLSGNEAISLGLIRAGLGAYIAYPMTPSSGILHFCAQISEDFSLQVIHPENEIAVMLMALGFSYAGKRAAVGTSGGGFCLMTEGLSLAGMTELPVVVVVSQRPGPSTGVPTYTAQADLNFVLRAGQGEFPRLVVAPGDPEEAYLWSAAALNLSWKWQLPALILVDKALSEGAFSFDIDAVGEIAGEEPCVWDRKETYRRYLNTKSGVSPLAFPPERKAIVKVNSYEHDESGVTVEAAEKIAAMQEKRLRKWDGLKNNVNRYETVKVYGKKDAAFALVCWGSNKWVCIEVALVLNIRVVQPLVISPFPREKLCEALDGVEKVICVENNANGQLAGLLTCHGFRVDERILKYDGRPFTLDELKGRTEGLL
jgi:2-oxoglutarate ferredoxin oxidoreductase subunit alpha